MADPSLSKHRVFSPPFKHAVILRLEAGEALAAVARDTGISRKVLYGWRTAWRAEGVAGLSRKRGPKPGSRERRRAARLEEAQARLASDAGLTLAKAQSRIQELERIIGRQQAGLDFFQRALRALDEAGTPAPSSTPSSKR